MQQCKHHCVNNSSNILPQLHEPWSLKDWRARVNFISCRFVINIHVHPCFLFLFVISTRNTAPLLTRGLALNVNWIASYVQNEFTFWFGIGKSLEMLHTLGLGQGFSRKTCRRLSYSLKFQMLKFHSCSAKAVPAKKKKEGPAPHQTHNSAVTEHCHFELCTCWTFASPPPPR